MPKPASSSATLSSVKPICCRHGRRSPGSTSRSRTSPALAGTLRRITELAPNDLAATIKLARLYLLAGGNVLDQALKLANKAGEIDPKNTDVLALKAAILFKLKDSDGAARAAQEALAIDPSNTGANVVAAGVKLSQGDADGALKALASVSKDHADDLAVIFLKINIFSRKGDLRAGRSSACAN